MALENPNQRNKDIAKVQSELNFMYETHNRRDLGKVFELLQLDTLKDKQRGGTVNFPQASLHLAVGVFLARTLTDLSWVELQRGWDLTTGDGRPPVLDDKSFAVVKTHLRNFSITLNSFSTLFMENRDSLTAEWCRTGGFAKVVNLFLTGFPISFFLNFVQPTPPVPPTSWSWPVLFHLANPMQETSVKMFLFICQHPQLTEAFIRPDDFTSFNYLRDCFKNSHPIPDPPVPLSEMLEALLQKYHPNLPIDLLRCFRRFQGENLRKFLSAKPQFYIYQEPVEGESSSGRITRIILSLDKTTLERFNQEEIHAILAKLMQEPKTEKIEKKLQSTPRRNVTISNLWRRIVSQLDGQTVLVPFPHLLPSPAESSRETTLFLWVGPLDFPTTSLEPLIAPALSDPSSSTDFSLSGPSLYQPEPSSSSSSTSTSSTFSSSTTFSSIFSSTTSYAYTQSPPPSSPMDAYLSLVDDEVNEVDVDFVNNVLNDDD